MNPIAATFTPRIINAGYTTLRLLIQPGEVYRLPEAGECLRVVAGHAWLTYQRQDVFLHVQETACLPTSREAALISAIGQAPLVLEVLNSDAYPLL